jgi:hypothetical protein
MPYSASSAGSLSTRKVWRLPVERTKFCESGNNLATSTAQTTPSTAMPLMAARQPPRSASPPATRRPVMPPTAVPAMYSPLALAWLSWWTSSRKYAMATAGRPAIAIPCRPLSASRVCQFGAIAQRTAIAAAAATDQRISLVRPSTSEAGPAISSAIPRPIVAKDTLKALWLGDTWNTRANSGRSAWVL